MGEKPPATETLIGGLRNAESDAFAVVDAINIIFDVKFLIMGNQLYYTII